MLEIYTCVLYDKTEHMKMSVVRGHGGAVGIAVASQLEGPGTLWALGVCSLLRTHTLGGVGKRAFLGGFSPRVS